MLQQTFLHIPGIGEATERKMWKSGIGCWNDYLCRHGAGALRGRKIASAVREVEESMQHFENGNWNYFDRCLPSPHKWRAYDDLCGKALYVDIETDGMSDCEITVIGTYDGNEVKSFVAGRNLEDALEEIENHPLIVTFNGSMFDMPVIRRHFQYHLFNHVHIDLRFPLKRLGYSGGLKRIEQMFGIERSQRTLGLDGWDAVRLWREYEAGSEHSLQTLIEYNAEDIRNLKPLMEHVHQRLSCKCREEAVDQPI